LIRSQWERQSIADTEQRPPRKYYKLSSAGEKRWKLKEALSAAGQAGCSGSGRNMNGVWLHYTILRIASLLVPSHQTVRMDRGMEIGTLVYSPMPRNDFLYGRFSRWRFGCGAIKFSA